MRIIESLGSDFDQAIGNQELVVFAGSGISIWRPTHLPTGIELSGTIARAVLGTDPDTTSLLRDPAFLSEYQALPFEIVMQQCPRLAYARRGLADVFANAQPNPVHRSIAGGLADGTVAHVVTTNYDCALEASLQSLRTSRVNRVIRADDSPGHNSVYLKIHGSADDSDGGGMVVALTDEKALPQWKWELLSELINGRVLVLVGYSGRDFELCPALERMQPRSVWWNTLPLADLPIGCRRVLDRHNGNLVSCDMRELLTRILGPVEPLQRDFGPLETWRWPTLDDVSLRVWGIGILNRLGYPAIAGNIAKKIESEVVGSEAEPTYWAQRGDAAHQRGQYRDAATHYENAAAIVAATDASLSSRYLLSASDNFRCYGRFLRGYRRMQRAVKLDSEDPIIAALAGTKALLFLRHLYQVTRPIPWLQRKIQRRARKLIEEVRSGLLEGGEYFDFQQLALWTRRFRLEHTLTAPPNLYAALPIDDGYRQLGYTMAQMIAFRDAVLIGGRVWTPAVEKEAVSLALKATSRGILAEAWKLYYLLLRRGVSAKRTYLKTSWAIFLQCQYNLPMRLWQILAMN